MDTSSTPAQADTSALGALDESSAGAAFAAMLGDDLEKELPPADAPEPDAPAEVEEVETAAQDDNETVTVLIDGKPVELTKDQISKAVKGDWQQADATRKTMAAAEVRKTAEAEIAKTRDERNQYAQGLQRAQMQLEGALQDQQRIDWTALLEADPVEYLKQQHLAQARQTALQQNQQQQQQINAVSKAENDAAFKDHLQSQREQLLAKVPEWKDEAKQKAATADIAKYLIDFGYPAAAVLGEYDAQGRQISPGITDHLPVLLARKAMLYDQLMSKASVAAKKVANLPQRMERSAGNDAQTVDKRQASFQRLSKSGRVEDAGSVFANMFS